MNSVDLEHFATEILRLNDLIDEANDFGETPLMYAMTKGRKAEQLAWILLSNGASVTAVDSKNQSVFHWADQHASQVSL